MEGDQLQPTVASVEEADLPDKPYLKPWLRIAREDDRLILEYAHSAVILEGKAVEKLLPPLLPVLDGTRTVDEIVDYVGEAVRPAVINALEMLAERDLLVDGPPTTADTPIPVAETAQALAAITGDGRTPTESQANLERATAGVAGSGSVAAEIAKLLRVSGVAELTMLDWPGSADELRPLDLTVVAPEPGELPELEGFNRLALDARSPWLQVLPYDGRIAAIGPLYVPDDTCCYECYRRRRGSVLDLGDDNFWALEKNPAPYPSTPSMQQTVAGLSTMLALRWLGDPGLRETPSDLPATMHALEWVPQMALSAHHVHRVPRCPVCFPDDRGTPSPWHD